LLVTGTELQMYCQLPVPSYRCIVNYRYRVTDVLPVTGTELHMYC